MCIVKIDTIGWSFCFRQVCKTVYPIWDKETRPTLCKSDAKPRSGIRDLKQNKHQLLHRIASVLIFTNLQYLFATRDK